MTRNVLVLLVTLGALAACDDGGSSSGVGALDRSVQTAFYAGPVDEPIDGDNVNLTLQPTAEPFNI